MKEYNWVRIAENIDELLFPPTNLLEIDADGKIICLGRHNGQLFAFARKCPHASGSLVEGFVDPLGNVVCPLHRYKFCMSNGRNVSGEGYYLKHWPVEVRQDGVFVGMEKSWLSGLL
jgi:nitrite reductase/ring-hydroxylating ferredoxin subunit